MKRLVWQGKWRTNFSGEILKAGIQGGDMRLKQGSGHRNWEKSQVNWDVMRLRTPRGREGLLLSTYLRSAPRDVEFFWSAKGPYTCKGSCKSCRDCKYISEVLPGKIGSASNPHRLFYYTEIIIAELPSCWLESDEFTPFILLSSREKSAYSGPPDLQRTHVLREDKVIFNQCELEASLLVTLIFRLLIL